ncbi:MAG: sodium:solute symporter [Alphaproteobacteria bacterium]|nr:sodium:solute symporter [Alphaproteobacteria bacterium]
MCFYGLYIGRKNQNINQILVSNYDAPWFIVLFGVMSTQASAITYLSLPGQAYHHGLKFVQFYFGLPIAMFFLIYLLVPLYKKYQLISIYSYLENRFNKQTRYFIASLFLISRSLSTGISIFAPALILTHLFNISIIITSIIIGGILIIYTAYGGAKSVSKTQQWQFLGIILGMIGIAFYLVKLLPNPLAIHLSHFHLQDKLQVFTSGFNKGNFNWNDKYNLWSGMIGGFFLQLSYFGTDQSQVSRYLIGKNIKNIKLGLLFNALLKIPMQLGILFIGILIYLFYTNSSEPIFFNQPLVDKALKTTYSKTLESYRLQYDVLNAIEKKILAQDGSNNAIEVNKIKESKLKLQEQFKITLKKAIPSADLNDTNYIFIYFLKNNLPTGLLGMMLALLFMASWGSIAPALHALAKSTMIEFKSFFTFDFENEKIYIKKFRTIIVIWGIFAILIAILSSRLGSLIEVVNVLGSLFYGVILGVFLVGFFLPQIKGFATFWSAIITEFFVIIFFLLNYFGIIGIGFLWLNAIGSLGLIVLAIVIQQISKFTKYAR